ncbi:MAG: DUF3276 family protein [Armatimonadota bacterium]|nr:PUR family DNA/RNA-binding protein [Armatimonadota bacterium]MDW8157064.1 DUF3276 family protein [Armatimonadota bacterium]
MVEVKRQANHGRQQGLFSAQVKGAGRTYFFDVREAKAGGRYLVISESRKTESGHERSRVVVFPDQVGEFEEALHRAARALQEDGRSRATKMG